MKTAAPTLGNGGNFTRGPTRAKPPAPAAPPPIAGVGGRVAGAEPDPRFLAAHFMDGRDLSEPASGVIETAGEAQQARNEGTSDA